ncbi:MAG: hypothetical protein NUV74_02290 [Candidatus Brocadiaceae bacterium]|nr:hypothetical protein [Candidatus Brocadiaceae bacterium]
MVVLGLRVSFSQQAFATQTGKSETEIKDVRVLYQSMLEWAVLNKPLPGQSSGTTFPDYNLIKDATVIRVSSRNLPSEVKLSLPNRQIHVLSEEKLQKNAAENGDFFAFYFGKLETIGEFAELDLELRWFTSKSSHAALLSGGGTRIRFRWQEGKWRFEKLLGMWIS